VHVAGGGLDGDPLDDGETDGEVDGEVDAEADGEPVGLLAGRENA
jgi:hypothetical protein